MPPNHPLFVRGDAAVAYGAVIGNHDVLPKAGVGGVGLVPDLRSLAPPADAEVELRVYLWPLAWCPSTGWPWALLRQLVLPSALRVAAAVPVAANLTAVPASRPAA